MLNYLRRLKYRLYRAWALVSSIPQLNERSLRMTVVCDTPKTLRIDPLLLFNEVQYFPVSAVEAVLLNTTITDLDERLAKFYVTRVAHYRDESQAVPHEICVVEYEYEYTGRPELSHRQAVAPQTYHRYMSLQRYPPYRELGIYTRQTKTFEELLRAGSGVDGVVITGFERRVLDSSYHLLASFAPVKRSMSAVDVLLAAAALSLVDAAPDYNLKLLPTESMRFARCVFQLCLERAVELRRDSAAGIVLRESARVHDRGTFLGLPVFCFSSDGPPHDQAFPTEANARRAASKVTPQLARSVLSARQQQPEPESESEDGVPVLQQLEQGLLSDAAASRHLAAPLPATATATTTSTARNWLNWLGLSAHHYTFVTRAEKPAELDSVRERLVTLTAKFWHHVEGTTRDTIAIRGTIWQQLELVKRELNERSQRNAAIRGGERHRDVGASKSVVNETEVPGPRDSDSPPNEQDGGDIFKQTLSRLLSQVVDPRDRVFDLTH